MESRLCYEVVTMAVVASGLPCARGIAEAAFLFVAGSAAMPEPNRVIQREIYSPTLVKKHGVLTDLE